MSNSYPHQKMVCVHKPKVKERFLQISNEEWMEANKTLSPYGLQLYLYLASNRDDYEFALSPADAELRAGIKNTSFHKYMKRLEEEGYIVWRHGNTFDFYTSPRDPKERTHPDDHSEYINFEETSNEVENSLDGMTESALRSTLSSDEGGASYLVSVSSQSNREIDNRYIDKTESGIDNIDAGTPRAPARPDGKPSELASKGSEEIFFSRERINPDEFVF